jgi:hypothetical protein
VSGGGGGDGLLSPKESPEEVFIIAKGSVVLLYRLGVKHHEGKK